MTCLAPFLIASGCEEIVFSEMVEEIETLQLVLDRVFHFGEAELDAYGESRITEVEAYSGES